jgi:adhesin/invasin
MKRIIFILLALILSASLFGCGSGGGDPLPVSGTDPNSPVVTPGTDPIIDPGTASVGSLAITFRGGSSTTTLIANGADYALVDATVLDTDNNPLAGQTVSFVTSAGSFSNGTTTLNLAVTDADGIASINFVAPANLGSAAISAKSGGVNSSSGLTATFVPGPVVNIDLNAAPMTLNPEGTSDIEARVTDANGHPIQNETITFSLPTKASGSPSVSPSFLKTDADGFVSTTYTAGTSNGADVLKATTANGTSNTVDLTVNSAAVVVGTLTLKALGGETTVTADGASTVTVEATVLDTNGDPAKSVSVAFALTGAGTLGTSPVSTGATGKASVTYTAPTTTGTAKITATASGFSSFINITLVPGVPASIALSASPATVYVASAQNKNKADVFATVKDAQNNAVPGETVNFYINQADNASGATLSATSATTNLSGVARILYSAGGSNGVDTVSGEVTSAALAAATCDITVQADIKKVAKVLIDADRNVLPTTATATVVVTALDSGDKPVPGVTLIAAGSGNGTALPLAPGTLTTDANGQITLEVKDTTAENITLTVRADILAFQETFYFGPTLVFVPDSVAGIGEVTLTALLLDAAKAPIQGQPVTFSTITYTDEVATALDSLTKANGTAQVTVTDPATGGLVKIRAVSGAISSTTDATINFQTEPGTLNLSATATDAVIATGGNTDIVAVIVDGDDTPAAGITLNVTTTGTATADPATGTTDEFGTFTTNITVAANEDVVITIEDSSGALSVDVPLYFGSTIQLFPPTAEGIADGTTVTELQAYVRSATGAVIPGVPVDFAVRSGSALINASRVTTGNDGVARVNVTNSEIGSATIDASAGTAPPDSSVIEFTSGTPANLALTSNPVSPVSLSLFGTASITATVTDTLGNEVPDNTQVTFTTTGGSITPVVGTTTGVAVATFDAGTVAGLYTVTVTAGSVSKTLDIKVNPAAAGTIRVDQVTPEMIQVFGSTGTQFSTIRFLVQDVAGNAVPDGTFVEVFLDSNQLGGGEAISNGAGYSTSLTAATSNGIAQVTLRSGTVAGTVDVIGRLNAGTPSEISTVAQVTIVGGFADGKHLSIAANVSNLAGALYSDLPSTVTAVVADRFGNIVPDGNNVSFQSECGRIGESVGFTTSTQQGLARAVFRTSNPMLSGDPLGSGELLQGPAGSGRIGACRILVYTTGNESFIDANGNGIFDGADICSDDLSEPYIDANDSGVWEAGELFVDVNQDGSFTGPDGTCSNNTVIWTSANLLMTGNADLIVERETTPGVFADDLDTADISLALGQSQKFRITLGDVYDNSLVAGTTLKVTKFQGSGGLITGSTEATLADSIGFASFAYFTVRSDTEATAKPATLEIDVTVGTSAISLTDPITGLSSGNNNGPSIYTRFPVNINQPPPVIPAAPTVSFTIPANGGANVALNSAVTVFFSEPMNTLTINGATVTASCTSAGSFNLGAPTASDNDQAFTFAPGTPFTAGDTCTVTVTTAVRDANDNLTMAVPASFTFTTAP